MDSSILLFLAVIITGVFSFLNFMNFQKFYTPTKWYCEYIRSLFPVLLFVFLVRSFFFEPFQIASSSMLPTLYSGDFVFVNKNIFPVINRNFLTFGLSGKLTRGDVIVFKNPLNKNLDVIKRIIGIPGDFITYTNKNIFINGHKLPETFIKTTYNTEIVLENIDKNKYQLYNDPYYPTCVSYKQLFVPDHFYFVLGDNRDHSNDSRFWGFVPESYVIGRAFAVWMHWDHTQILPKFSSIRLIK